MNSIFTNAYSITIKQHVSRISIRKVSDSYLIKCKIYSCFTKNQAQKKYL